MKKLHVFILILIHFQIEMKAQTIGLYVNKPKPRAEQSLTKPLSVGTPTEQYSTLKKHFQTVDNQYFRKKNTVEPNKIPLVFSVETLPFFCKIEYKMGFNKKLPLKFRLGDVQYVDELEGKKH